MAGVNDGISELPDVVPLFPLSEVVLFPNQFLHLHIFEPRYRVMTSDAMQGGKLIAMALLKPGFEELYYTHHAPIEPVVGVGRIMAAEPLDEGKFNILLRGIARAEIMTELPGRPYRCGRLRGMCSPCMSAARAKELRSSLQEAVQCCAHLERELFSQWQQLFDSSLGMGDLADLIAGSLPVTAEVRQTLLAEPDPAARSCLLVEHLSTLCAVAQQRARLSIRGDWTAN